MKDFKTTKEEHSIEVNVCIPMNKLKREQLKGEEKKIFNLMKATSYIPLDSFGGDEKPYLIQLIEARITMFDFEIDDARISTTISLVSNNMAYSLLYLTYLQYLCKLYSIKLLSFEQFCDFFESGFFKHEDLETIWKAQKIEKLKNHSDNLLDYEEAYKSIKF
jgi:hypothetical protein